jgi:hypothetical protein
MARAERKDGLVNTDRIVSISAIVVAVGTLALIVYQTALTRRAQEAGVLPYLQIAMSFSSEGAFLNVFNSGLGPAVVESIAVRSHEIEVSGDPYDYYLRTGHADSEFGGLSIDRVLPGILIPAGRQTLMLGSRVPGEMNQYLLSSFSVPGIVRTGEEPSGAVVEIVYASVYGDRWRIRSDRLVPEPLQ